MSPNCPVCEEAVAPDARRCEHCGVPASLFTVAQRVLSEPDASPRPVERPTRTEAARPKQAAASTNDTQAELCSRLAHDMRNQTFLLERLGGDAPALLSEMSQAALTQADGRLGEALGLLRNAHARVVVQASELFERRCAEVEQRQRALSRDGVGVDVGDELGKMRAAWESGRTDVAVESLTGVDHRLARIESDWSGLRSLLGQIDSLRDAVKATGRDLPQVEEDVRQVRELLARKAIDAEGLDAAAQTAARALMLLHESLPPVLEQELQQHAEVLDDLPEGHEAGARARALHAEATRHLRRGRLADASARLTELRAVIQEIQRTARVSPPAPRPLAPPTAAGALAASKRPSDAGLSTDTLNRLLGKARGLAARVRSLPPDSEIAFEAAGEIRRATELLRVRKLDEAEQTLTRLMRTLDAENPGGG